jgi:hypothetical protein
MASEPNQGATGQAGAEEATARADTAGPGDSARSAAGPEVNQGATGSRPIGESPLSADSKSDDDPFAKRPEAFVGGAFAGGFALALILRRFRP